MLIKIIATDIKCGGTSLNGKVHSVPLKYYSES